MKRFEKGEFACPVEGHSNVSGVDGNGQQHIWTCLKCMLDDRGICNGEQLVCENNHKRNTYSVFLMNGSRYVKHISDGKDEVLTLPELMKMAELIEKRGVTMELPSKKIVEKVRTKYPIGTRVELVKMDDVQAPPVGTLGTVKGVDDTASLLVDWDNGSGLNVIYGVDVVKIAKG